MGSHKTPAILDLLHQKNITPSIIPGSCTGLVQPLDVSGNKLFKELIRDLTDEWIFELESVAEFEKWMVGDCTVMITGCVGNGFCQFHHEKAEVICHSFQKVGLSLPING
ncbi:hypothetical protein L873DRAFT_1891494 [Choiromyces venosus 120613-1]|uniref:DDE-1 domain-containing protein n=1 Tax=Choiromyces venosus 120613-1 TaxID=1336337 RepID=A0A3N4JSR3_9PEZI|nr:hypothetical protein L873DRAFT_1891494 [Choiromyces venosus 120613-1]